MSHQIVHILNQSAAVAANLVDKLGVLMLLALGLTTAGASFLAGV